MRRLLTGLAVLFVALAASITPVDAFDSLLTDAVAEYPAIAGTKLDDCALCHTGGTALNAYGAAYDAAGKNFGAIESADSDGDGFSNIAEIVALTFPGDASDKPVVGGGRVVSRGSLDAGAEVFALAAAPDVDRDEAFILWGERGAARDGAKAHGGLRGWLVDDEGAALKKAVSIAVGDVSEDHGISAAYATKKKRFAATWTSADFAAMSQLLKSKVNKLYKKPVEIGAAATGPVVDWDNDLGKFIVASANGTDVDLATLDTKGKVGRLSGGRFAADVVSEFSTPHAFASGPFESGRLLLASVNISKGAEPGTALVEGGEATVVDEGIAKASKKGLGMAAAMPGDAPGMIVVRGGTKVTTGQVETDGTLAGKAAKLKGAKAARIGVAPQSDGTFLVVWIDSKKGTVLAVDRSADGKTTSKPFEIQADGESIDSDLLAVVPLGDSVLVVYVTEGDPGVVRTAIVGPAE